MKKFFTLLATLGMISTAAFAQAPDKMSFQAIVRDAGNILVTETTVGIQISILRGAPDGIPVYVETLTPATNSNGLVSLEIGGGTKVSGEFSDINWASDSHFIKTEIDPTGGTSYTISSISQLLSVPYALHAATAEAAVGELKMQIEELQGKTGIYKVSDSEGNSYAIVRIGSQFWMAENLKSTRFNDGTAIPLVTDNTEWTGITTAGYCWHSNDSAAYADPYGALYNWYAVNTGKLCPTGWHLPTEAEWITLTDHLGGDSVAGGKLKESGTTHWNNSSGATNETGFTALPGGSRGGITGLSCCMGDAGYWWSSTEENESDAWFKFTNVNNNEFKSSSTTKKIGLSVRCIRD